MTFCGDSFVYPIPRRSQPHLSGKSRGGRLERRCHAWRSYSKWFLFRLAKKTVGETQHSFLPHIPKTCAESRSDKISPWWSNTCAQGILKIIRMFGVERTGPFLTDNGYISTVNPFLPKTKQIKPLPKATARQDNGAPTHCVCLQLYSCIRWNHLG